MAFFIGKTCVGCTACARQCPTEAIQGRPDEVHAVDPLRCTDCGVCGQVCPVEGTVLDARGAPAQHVPRDARKKPVVIDNLCNGCGSCVDICPFGSLAVEGPLFSGLARLRAPDTCVSCGDCERACIKEAIRLSA